MITIITLVGDASQGRDTNHHAPSLRAIQFPLKRSFRRSENPPNRKVPFAVLSVVEKK